ncbi:hypothetical protein BAE44_0024632, partial [Dichanthelium oligosanthes]
LAGPIRYFRQQLQWAECCTKSLTLVSSEYARGDHASTYGDVYSFGIVLLETLTGKRPTDHLFVNELNIVSFVERSFPDKILDVIDTPLQDDVKSTHVNMVTENGAYQCLFPLLQVALSCTRHYYR